MNRLFTSALLVGAAVLSFSAVLPAGKAFANPFAVAGISGPSEVSAFLMDLQGAIKADEKGAVSSMISYPLRLYSNGKVTSEYKDAAAFTASYDKIMTPAVKSAIGAASTSSLFANAEGVSIGDGQVWINKQNGFLKITSINP